MIYELFERGEGFSFNPFTKELNPESGYMVSIAGHETWTDRSNLIKDGMAYAEDKASMLLHVGNLYVGCWKSGDRYCLDISQNIADRDTAIALGKANNQIAIWDCAKGEEVVL